MKEGLGGPSLKRAISKQKKGTLSAAWGCAPTPPYIFMHPTDPPGDQNSWHF